MGSGRRLQVSIANSVQSGAVAVDILLCHRHVLHRNIACQVRGRNLYCVSVGLTVVGRELGLCSQMCLKKPDPYYIFKHLQQV